MTVTPDTPEPAVPLRGVAAQTGDLSREAVTREWLASGLTLLMILEPKCGAPAPLVVNGGPYVGCQEPSQHEGRHKFTVEWRNDRDAT